MVQLNNASITQLPRYLRSPSSTHAFGAVEKPVAYLAMQNKSLAYPVSLDGLPIAGGIEDIATNAPEVTSRLEEQLENDNRLLGIMLTHAAQAIDLRKGNNGDLALSESTTRLHQIIRQHVGELSEDRILSTDFDRMYNLIKQLRF